jgi:hypothetical protein
MRNFTISKSSSFARWEIGWLKDQEVILPNLVFQDSIQQSILQLRKHHNIKPLVVCQFSGTGLQSQNFWENVLFGYGRVNFGSRYLRIYSDFLQHVYTHSKGFLVSFSMMYMNFIRFKLIQLEAKM